MRPWWNLSASWFFPWQICPLWNTQAILIFDLIKLKKNIVVSLIYRNHRKVNLTTSQEVSLSYVWPTCEELITGDISCLPSGCLGSLFLQAEQFSSLHWPLVSMLEFLASQPDHRWWELVLWKLFICENYRGRLLQQPSGGQREPLTLRWGFLEFSVQQGKSDRAVIRTKQLVKGQSLSLETNEVVALLFPFRSVSPLHQPSAKPVSESPRGSLVKKRPRTGHRSHTKASAVACLFISVFLSCSKKWIFGKDGAIFRSCLHRTQMSGSWIVLSGNEAMENPFLFVSFLPVPHPDYLFICLFILYV